MTAIEVFTTLQCELERNGIVLAIARTSHPLRQVLKKAGLTERIGTQPLSPTVRTGVQAFLEQQTK